MNREDNRRLCEVGAETPMGTLLRRYWIPAYLSDGLEPNGPPQRLRVLGETLVAFRDAEGRPAVLDDSCPHRGAPLLLGRTGDGCITCIFHGWKITVDGRVADAPNVRGTRFTERARIPTIPAVDCGGILWIYLGPEALKPPEPNHLFGRFDGPGERYISRVEFSGNWVQALEGSLDSAHLGILHADYAPLGGPDRLGFVGQLRADGGLSANDHAPDIDVADTDFGYYYAGLRRLDDDADGDARLARVSAWIMPYIVYVPPHVVAMYTPVDDTHTVQTVVNYSTDGIDAAAMSAMNGLDRPGVVVDGVLQAFESNRFLQDRSSMETSWSGLAGILVEDLGMVAGMKPIIDREKLTMVASDAAIIRAHKRLLAAADALQDGEEPFHMPSDEQLRVDSWEGLVPGGQSWVELSGAARLGARRRAA